MHERPHVSDLLADAKAAEGPDNRFVVRKGFACLHDKYVPGGWIGPTAAVQRSTSSGPAFRYSAAPPRTSLLPVDTKYRISSGSGMYPTWERPLGQQPSPVSALT
ncbi:hypothetical protein [Methanosphaerula palustris]|uniref:hypothetical protein n=1 Tax=Methanosphaerula palustris TaxID=475088 RepID=UPI002E81029E|nr:hypothetical protein [Methanosphaerula palustris]